MAKSKSAYSEPTKQGKEEHFWIWDQVKNTNPKYTRAFTKFGGKELTTIDPMYQIQMMTDLFGPVGIGWKYKVDYKYIDGLVFAEVTIKYFTNFAVFCGNGAMALHTSRRGGAGAITGDANITAKLLSFIIHNYKNEKEIENFSDLQLLLEKIRNVLSSSEQISLLKAYYSVVDDIEAVFKGHIKLQRRSHELFSDTHSSSQFGPIGEC